MTSRRLTTLVGASVFLVLACASLYRLLVGFRLSIGGEEIGQTSSFLVFVISTALAVMMFRSGSAD